MRKAAQAACSKADDAAVSACHRSALLCIATAGKPFHAGEAQCSYDAGAGDATCTCLAAVNCSYRILY